MRKAGKIGICLRFNHSCLGVIRADGGVPIFPFPRE